MADALRQEKCDLRQQMFDSARRFLASLPTPSESDRDDQEEVLRALRSTIRDTMGWSEA
jgi:hypothetical protein